MLLILVSKESSRHHIPEGDVAYAARNLQIAASTCNVECLADISDRYSTYAQSRLLTAMSTRVANRRVKAFVLNVLHRLERAATVPDRGHIRTLNGAAYEALIVLLTKADLLIDEDNQCLERETRLRGQEGMVNHYLTTAHQEGLPPSLRSTFDSSVREVPSPQRR